MQIPAQKARIRYQAQNAVITQEPRGTNGDDLKHRRRPTHCDEITECSRRQRPPIVPGAAKLDGALLAPDFKQPCRAKSDFAHSNAIAMEEGRVIRPRIKR